MDVRTAEDVLGVFAGGPELGADNPYLVVHAERIAFTIGLLRPHIEDLSRSLRRPVRILDIGPGHLTQVMARAFGDLVTIDALGLNDDPVIGPDVIEHFIEFDLNDAALDARMWPSATPHDVVVMAEVLEHLYTAPHVVLGFLKRYLEPGGLLVIQTPNAVAGEKRVAMARGRNPFELIRESRDNPGHFREYTMAELEDICAAAGLEVVEGVWADYWPHYEVVPTVAEAGWFGVLRKRVLIQACRRVPSLRAGLTIVARA